MSRCILWVGGAGAVPASLVSALDRGALQLAIVREPTEVMVELAEAEADALIVCEPEEQPRLTELLDAVAVYFPQTRCWRYSAHPAPREGEPMLKPFDGHVIPRRPVANMPSDLPVDSAARVKGANQRLRSLVVRVDAPMSETPLVSDQELAMLLGPESGSTFVPGEEKGHRGVTPG